MFCLFSLRFAFALLPRQQDLSYHKVFRLSTTFFKFFSTFFKSFLLTKENNYKMYSFILLFYVAVSLTALTVYHSFFIMSTTFFNFFQYFFLNSRKPFIYQGFRHLYFSYPIPRFLFLLLFSPHIRLPSPAHNLIPHSLSHYYHKDTLVLHYC